MNIECNHHGTVIRFPDGRDLCISCGCWWAENGATMDPVFYRDELQGEALADIIQDEFDVIEAAKRLSDPKEREIPFKT